MKGRRIPPPAARLPKVAALVLACALAATAAPAAPFGTAAPLALPSPPQVALAQQPGAALPLDATMTESDGRAVRLRALFAGERAVILVPGYYRCAELCGLVMQGVLEAMAASRLPADSWRIVAFSFDPTDTPATALHRAAEFRAYEDYLGTRSGAALQRADLHLLTGSGAVAERLTRAMGYAVVPDAAISSAGGSTRDAFSHSAGFAVATPDGRISRYFPGVRFDADALRLAVIDASGHRIGSLSDRLTLLCGHYDPATGRYSIAIMGWLRFVGCAGAALLGFWIWRRRRVRTA